MIYEKTKGQVPLGPLSAKQNIQAKKVYCFLKLLLCSSSYLFNTFLNHTVSADVLCTPWLCFYKHTWGWWLYWDNCWGGQWCCWWVKESCHSWQWHYCIRTNWRVKFCLCIMSEDTGKQRGMSKPTHNNKYITQDNPVSVIINNYSTRARWIWDSR